jgi:hypothetical protein
LLSACYQRVQWTKQEELRILLTKRDDEDKEAEAQKRPNEHEGERKKTKEDRKSQQKPKKPKKSREELFNERLEMPSWVPD